MNLEEVVVYVEDMARATAFYRDVLGLRPTYESPYWTTFASGACTLALHAGGVAPPDPTFVVSDVDAVRDRLVGEGVEVTGIRDPAPGLRVFDLRDSEGNRLSIESRELGGNET